MSDFSIQQLKQQLLARRISGEVDESEYRQLLAEIDKHHQESGSSDASRKDDRPSSSTDAYRSVGSQITGMGQVGATAGTELDQFTLVDRIGRGGMGEVWKAHDTVCERTVVVKLLPPELMHSPNEMNRIMSAYQKVHELNHQNICPLYHLGQDASLGYFLVMKYLRGLTLDEYVRGIANQKNHDLRSAIVRILNEVAEALDYAHRNKIVHRDVKPQNIMVSNEGREVHLLDFGLAAEIRTSVSRVSDVQMDNSGTYPYMSPEQWRGQQQDGRSDQYSLGVVAYELLAGTLPFDGEPFVVRQCALQEQVPAIETLSSDSNRAIERAMAKRPSDRFATCADFVGELARGIQSNAKKPTTAKIQWIAKNIFRDTSSTGLSCDDPGDSDDIVLVLDDSKHEELLDDSNQVADGQNPCRRSPEERMAAFSTIIEKFLRKPPRSLASEDYQRINQFELYTSDLMELGFDLSQLVELPNLRWLRLNFSDHDVSTLENVLGFEKLDALARLVVCRGNFRALEPITRIPCLSELVLYNADSLESLAGLENHRNHLINLSIDSNSLSNHALQPISTLHRLESLSISGCTDITSLDPIGQLKGLKQLNINGTQISNLDTIHQFPNLVHVEFSRTKVEHIEPLLSLKNLLFARCTKTQFSERSRNALLVHVCRNIAQGRKK